MVLEITQDTDYTPASDDSPKCWGQLRLRDTEIETECVGENGEKILRKLCGPRVTYFPKGAKPDLPESVAAQFLASGRGVAFNGEPVTFVSLTEILDGMPVT